IAEYFEVPLSLEEVPLSGYLDKHPEYSGHLCHRIYDLSKLKNAGVRMPEVHLHEGIELSLKALGY
ncbi:MAG: NAD-dependent dehydratase, partial [Lachnospiraceae bacterium]|nr:NAD-dependent dehydratase [Lachnospiraceae bacterium]